jgi:hypothetical protein
MSAARNPGGSDEGSERSGPFVYACRMSKPADVTADERTQRQREHETLVAYLKVKVEAGDWHGVSDAANDLRVLEAAHPFLLKQ